MLHGELDPTMPPERLEGLRAHFTGPAQLFAIVTGAGHVTINENPCVRSIYAAFLRAPAVVPTRPASMLTWPASSRPAENAPAPPTSGVIVPRRDRADHGPRGR
jgi:hypothetical protein